MLALVRGVLRACWLVVTGVLLAACQATGKNSGAPGFHRVGDPSGVSSYTVPGGGSGLARLGAEASGAPRELGRDARSPREAPIDTRLLPPPSIGGYMPMEAEVLLSPQQPLSTVQDGAGPQEPEHWSGLPLLSDIARRHDVELPVPVGFSVNYSAINRPSRVDRVSAGINGGPLVELPSLSFEAQAQVQIMIGRLDAWVLPMLNVYLLGGYVWNESSVDLTVDLPGAPNTSFTADGNLEGPTYGIGTTLAGGYGRYFLLGDINWNKVELGGLSEMDAMLATMRVGFTTTDLEWIRELRVYLATTYWDTARTISGTLYPMGGPISSIEYAVDQSPVDSATFGAGVHLGFSRHSSVVLEAQGYDDTFYFVGGFVFRF